MIASWTEDTVVSRSSTTCEIDTFITVVSSTITNWAAPRIRIVVFFCMPRGGPYGNGPRAGKTQRLTVVIPVRS